MQSFLLEKRDQIAEICRKHHVVRLSVFGSAARDDFDPARSDVDLLIEFEPGYMPKSSWLKLDIEGELEEVLHRRIDLLTSSSLRNPYLIREIDLHRQALYGA